LIVKYVVVGGMIQQDTKFADGVLININKLIIS
jgi:hypothetical protein